MWHSTRFDHGIDGNTKNGKKRDEAVANLQLTVSGPSGVFLATQWGMLVLFKLTLKLTFVTCTTLFKYVLF